MSKFLKLILVLLILNVPVDARNPKYDVYLLIGQSNMAGRGILEEGDREPVKGVWILDGNDQIVPASEPLNQYSTIRKRLDIQGYNLGDSFARKLRKRTHRRILLVVNARGGTSLEQWQKTAPADTFARKYGDDPELFGTPIPSFYDEAVRRCQTAQQYGELKGIIWHQGESNSSEARRNVYLQDLAVFVKDLRNDLGVDERVPFVAGEVNHASKHTAMNPVLNQVGELIPNAWCASAAGCGVNKDNLHFSRQGLIDLGNNYADIILDIVYHKKAKR